MFFLLNVSIRHENLFADSWNFISFFWIVTQEVFSLIGQRQISPADLVAVTLARSWVKFPTSPSFFNLPWHDNSFNMQVPKRRLITEEKTTPSVDRVQIRFRFLVCDSETHRCTFTAVSPFVPSLTEGLLMVLPDVPNPLFKKKKKKKLRYHVSGGGKCRPASSHHGKIRQTWCSLWRITKPELHECHNQSLSVPVGKLVYSRIT